MLGAFIVAGCYLSRTIDQATAGDVNNRSFTFTDGAVFHPALVNLSTTLSFTNNAANFTLSSSGGMATGTNRFDDACILTVATSTYTANTTGPQINDVITLEPCDFDSDNKRLTVENRHITATSMVATAVGSESSGGGENNGNIHPATDDDLSNQSFTFANGRVFHSALTNMRTDLEFTVDAAEFTLTSPGGNAMGTKSGTCTLTVTTSTYTPRTAGPQKDEVIVLNPCNFNSSNDTLIVTNRGFTETSEAATLR
jgi:hypothetical protein